MKIDLSEAVQEASNSLEVESSHVACVQIVTEVDSEDCFWRTFSKCSKSDIFQVFWADLRKTVLWQSRVLQVLAPGRQLRVLQA